MVFDKMVAICPDFRWLVCQILDPNLFCNIQNPDKSGFQIPNVLEEYCLITCGIYLTATNHKMHYRCVKNDLNKGHFGFKICFLSDLACSTYFVIFGVEK